MRSSSLPRIKVTRRNSLGNVEAANIFNDSVGNGMRSWAKSWLSGTGIASPATSPHDRDRIGAESDFDIDERRTISPPLAKRQLRRAPVLTLALLRLEEQLPTFCEHLADPSPENIYAACALIDSTVATASPGNHGSPSGFVGSPSSPRSSPSRSPIRNWLSGSSGSPTNANSVSSSAMALEGEWERFVLPLFLLAGAESIYASLGHSSDSRVARNLSTLYQRITKDLNLVREVLCDPLIASEGDRFVAPTLTLYYERASSLAKSLQALATFTQIRSQLILFHSRMWHSPKPDFGEQALLFHDLLPNLPREGASAMPMLKELEAEVLCWKYLMKTTAALEQCRFAETILSAQKTKGCLRPSSKACIRQWMRQTLQRLISIFPIIFDRIQAFSKPLYGFQALKPDLLPRGESHLGRSEDFESQILDFLRRQDKAGGPSMAVSVVLNASAVKQKKVEHLKIERGFALYDNPLGAAQDNEAGDDLIAQWPAVYMRTTVHHGLQPSSSSHGNILENMRRTTSRADRSSMLVSRLQDKSSYSNDGSASTLRPWSSESTKHSSGAWNSELNVLEYAPDSGGPSTSWPHASWKSLVAVLTGTGEEADSPVEETSKPSIFEGFEHASLRNLELDLKSLSLPTWAGTRDDDMLEEKGGRSPFSSRKLPRNNDQTAFHISALSDYMWLVVMIKSGEESRWHRRRSSKVVEEEASEFLAHFAGRLRMAECFQASRAQELREGTMKRNGLGSDLIDEIKATHIWNDEDVQIFLQALKVAYRLRAPRNSLAVPLNSSYRLGFRSAGGKSPKFGRNFARASPPLPNLQISAAALFLGPDLMHTIGME